MTGGHGWDRRRSSGRLPCAESPYIPYKRVQGAEEDHTSSRHPDNRCPGAVLANGTHEQHHAGKNAEGRDQSAHAVSHTDIINDNLGQQE